MRADLKAVADGLIGVVKEYTAAAVTPLLARIKELEAREIPESIKGQDGTSVTVDDVRPLISDAVAEAVKALPAAQPGKDADEVAITTAVMDQVSKALEAIPKPRDGDPGKDADIEVVRSVVQEQIASIPKPEVDYDRILGSIKEIVSMAVAAIPVPQPGKDADADAIAKSVLDKVMSVLDAIPAPKDGKDADPAEIEAAVARAVAALPPAEKGKDADPELIRQAVADAVAEIPAPTDGKSVTVEDVAPLIAEQVAKAVAEIPKPQDGKSVPIEDVQAMIDAAVAKAVAAMPVPEVQHGRDALDLDVLPGIEPEKTYTRNTYAAHAGGLWRAHGTTQGMRGWECVADGLADLQVEFDGERTFAVTAIKSSGAVVRKEARLPVVIDRGVWQEGYKDAAGYEMADGVTFGGSYWIAQRDTKEKPAYGCADWRLAVKKGRDAT